MSPSQPKLQYTHVPVIIIEDDEAEVDEEKIDACLPDEHAKNDTGAEDGQYGSDGDDADREDSPGEISMSEDEYKTYRKDHRPWTARLRNGSIQRPTYTQYWPGNTGIPSIDSDDIEDKDYEEEKHRPDRDDDERMADLPATAIIRTGDRPRRSPRNMRSNKRDFAAEWAAAVEEAEAAAERTDSIPLRLLSRRSRGTTDRATRVPPRASTRTCLVMLPTRKRPASLTSDPIKKPRTDTDVSVGPNTSKIPSSSHDSQPGVKVEVKTEDLPVTPPTSPALHVRLRGQARHDSRPTQGNDGFPARTPSVPSSGPTLVNNLSPSPINNTNHANTVQNLNERITRLNGTITAMAATVAATNDENAALQAENAQLKTQLEQARTGIGP